METILFFDDWALQRRDNCVRRLGEPEWRPEATLEDDLTEGTWNFPTVWYDEENALWKAIYCGAAEYPFPPERYQEALRRNVLPKTQVLLYAESDDGIIWNRPDLTDRVDLKVRHRKNQVLESGVHINGAPVFVDREDPDPERRLKYLCTYGAWEESEQRILTSGDGITWKFQDQGWGKRVHLDTPICVFYNEQKKTYGIANRLRVGERRVALIETKDFKEFSEPRLIVFPDSEDPPMVQFYGMPIFQYEGMFVGLLWYLHTDPSEIGHIKWFGPIDSALTYSYTGDGFNRAFHQPFIKRNERGEHGGGSVYASSMVVAPDNTIRFYSGGSKAEHFSNQKLNDAALMLHTLRLDGFVYLESYATQGRVTLRGVTIKGPELQINLKVPYGSARVQILDETGAPIPGLSFEESVPFTGDELFYEPQWNSGKDLAEVVGKQVFIDIELSEGNLYAIRGNFERTRFW